MLSFSLCSGQSYGILATNAGTNVYRRSSSGSEQSLHRRVYGPILLQHYACCYASETRARRWLDKVRYSIILLSILLNTNHDTQPPFAVRVYYYTKTWYRCGGIAQGSLDITCDVELVSCIYILLGVRFCIIAHFWVRTTSKT